MFGFIRRLLDHILRPITLEEFIEIVRRNGDGKITVTPYTKVRSKARSEVVGTIGNFRHGLRFVFVPKKKPTHRIVFQKWYFGRQGSSRGFVDVEEREDVAIALLLLGEQTLKYLEEKLQDTNVTVVFMVDGQIMDESRLAQLHYDAKQSGIPIPA